MIYFIIFFEKIIENILSSFRIIVYTAGYKHLGAFITSVVATIWLFVASVVIVGIADEPIKLLIYAIGQGTGVFLGSFIEEKIALGNTLLYVIIDDIYLDSVIDKLSKAGYGTTSLKASGISDPTENMLLILCQRKHKLNIKTIVRSIDKHALVIAKKTTTIEGSYVLG